MTYQIIGDTPIGPTSMPAGRAVITLDDGGGAPNAMLIADLRDGAVQVDWDRWSPWSLPNEGLADWSDVPAESLSPRCGARRRGEPSRSTSISDRSSCWLGQRLDQLSFRSVAFVQVD